MALLTSYVKYRAACLSDCSDVKGEVPMKTKTKAKKLMFSMIETIFAIGTSYVAGALPA
jgi:hypothetical protein